LPLLKNRGCQKRTAVAQSWVSKFLPAFAIAAIMLLMVFASVKAFADVPRYKLRASTIWFGPRKYGWDPAHPENGCRDYMDLFVDDAPWPIAATNVQVFKLDESLADTLDPALLKKILDNLDKRHISLCIQGAGLTSTPKTGQPQGFHAAGSHLRVAKKINAAGGIVRFLTFDEPLKSGTAAHYTPDQIAGQLAQYINEYRTVFPGTLFGDIEPIAAAKTWLDTFRRVSGIDMSYLHAEVDYHDSTWPEKARDLEDFCRKRAISFGMVYTGDEGSLKDGQWLQLVRDRMATYELAKGGHPDDAVIESRQLCPRNLLPETDSTKFTQLVNYYSKGRTKIVLDKPDPSAGQTQLSGKVLSANGKPAVGMAVKLWVNPRYPNAPFRDYTASGAVPPGATHATIGVRVNSEMGQNAGGDCDVSLSSMRFEPKGGQALGFNFVPGLKDWKISGNGKVGIGKDQSARSDMVLHLVANPKQAIHIDRASFPVKAGNAYDLIFNAAIPQKSEGCGYFVVVFAAGKEISRKIVPFEGGLHLDEQSETNEDGVFSFKRVMATGNYVKVSAVGDADHWPASTETTIGKTAAAPPSAPSASPPAKP
jgi:hypothetical protein